MPKNVRLAFIGAGGVAAGHYQRVKMTGKAEVVALVEPSRKSLKRFHERCPGSEGIPIFSDYEAMLATTELDGALVLSPHAFHYEHASACLKHGVHVLCEKPLVCSSRDARKLMKTAEKSGKVLSLSYQRHYEPVFQFMREEIQKGTIGEVQFVQAMQAQEWLRLTKGTWRQRLDISGGGQLNDSGSHLLDIVLWVTGLPVAEVYATGCNFGAEVDVNSAITLKFGNGAMGNLSIIGNAPAWHEDHTIIGSEGAFYLRQNSSIIHQLANGERRVMRLRKQQETPDSNFIRCILGKTETKTPPECGLQTLLVTEALWRSIKTGRPTRPKEP